MQVIKLSDKYYITIHHLKLYKPSKIKQQKLNFLLKNWNKAIRSARLNPLIMEKKCV